MVAMNIGQVLPQVGRAWRRPKHTFRLAAMPYVIQPFFIAPVLPGETMKQLLIQSRVVSDPVSNPLIGWWKEYFIFYVKHRDLNERDLLVKMMIEPGTDLTSLNSASDQQTYHYGGAPDWVKLCRNVVVEHFFRDEDETFSTASGLLGGLPMAHAASRGESWSDSLMKDAAMPDADPNDLSFQTVSQQQQAWEYLRAMKMTDMTYEDYLESYGVNVETPEEAHKPELVRYLREWSYPTNVVDPSTGTPSSAMSWSIAERADKDRFFREPGWLFGVTTTRAKLYCGAQTGSAASVMSDGMKWLPAIMRDDPSTSLVLQPVTAGPIPSTGDPTGYWIDIKDLLLYGDQFMNTGLTDATGHLSVAYRGGNLYMAEQEIRNLFKDSAAGGSKVFVREDGVVSLAILGAQRETT